MFAQGTGNPHLSPALLHSVSTASYPLSSMLGKELEPCRSGCILGGLKGCGWIEEVTKNLKKGYASLYDIMF